MKICHVEIDSYLMKAIKETGQFRCYCGSITEIRFYKNRVCMEIHQNELKKISNGIK